LGYARYTKEGCLGYARYTKRVVWGMRVCLRVEDGGQHYEL